MPEFLMYTLVCGLGIAFTAGALGTFVVWRRLAYFGDTLSHASLLGAALGIFLEISPNLTVIITSLCLALSLLALQARTHLANDTLLGIISHTALAAGLVCAGLMTQQRIDLWALLLGDLLTIDTQDVVLVCLLCLSTLIILQRYWQALVLSTLDESLAFAEGVPTAKLRLYLMLLLAIFIAFAMKMVGVLLLTALLIIPAATARRLSCSPQQMMILAAFFAGLAVVLGLGVSYFIDTATGPSIVLCAGIIFGMSLIVPQKN